MVVIENGRCQSKVLPEEGEPFVYPSEVGEGRELTLKNNPENILEQLNITINGKQWFVGSLAVESLYCRGMKTEEKINEETKILFATGLMLSNYRTGPIVTLVPIKQYKQEIQIKYRNFLQGHYLIRLNNQTRVFHVSDQLTILPECVSAAYCVCLTSDLKIKPEFKERKIRVVDLGSRNINYATLGPKDGKQLRFFDKESGTLDYGCIEVGEDQRAFIRRLIDDLASKWKRTDIVIFTGGGVLLLRKQLEEFFPIHVFADNPVFAAVLGVERMVNLKYVGQK